MPFSRMPAGKQPIIGCSTYRKRSHDTNVPLYGLMTSYVEAISLAGGIPLLIPLGLSEEALLTTLERVDGLLLPGGGDIDPAQYHGNGHEKVAEVDQDRDRVEIYLAQQATAMQKPLLAICRGHQVLNVALGGNMWEDIASEMPNAIQHDFNRIMPRNYLPHTVDVIPDSQLARVLGRMETAVNSLHHQGIRNLAPELVATAHSADGLVEAVEVPGHPFALGVQWHPENLVHDDPAMLNLFRALVDASVEHSAP